MEDGTGFDAISGDSIELPPGFRFHPTDEELITHYLSPKVLDCSFTALAVGQVDMNKVEPWDLPWKANMGEKEWYFFCLNDRKYPTGLRTNRATDAGYWKATGKDKEIFRQQSLVGMKKTLVFYRGRAPRGEKTNWVTHEFRLEGKNSVHNLQKSSKNEWVIWRIFNKSGEATNIDISGRIFKTEDYVSDGPQSPALPPLTEISSDENQPRFTDAEGSSHATCFSNRTMDGGNRFVDDSFTSSSYFNHQNFSALPFLNHETTSTSIPDAVMIGELSLRQGKLGRNMRQNPKTESWEDVQNLELNFRGVEEQEFPDISNCQIGLDCWWNH